MANRTNIEFWNRVGPADANGCMPWTGHKVSAKSPYGRVKWNGRTLLAHRLAWELEHGSAPADALDVCHRCDNPPCCNPAHLFLGSHEENMRDAIDKGRWDPSQCGNPVLHGTTNPKAKLTEEIVRTCRSLHESEHLTASELARRYGVHNSVMSRVLRREAWAHI